MSVDPAYIEANARRMHPDLYEGIEPSKEVKDLLSRYERSDEFAALSEWFAHRDIPLPWSTGQHIAVTVQHWDSAKARFEIDTEATKKVLARIVQKARSLGHGVEKQYCDDYFKIVVSLTNNCKITYQASRQTICERVVVGKKLVPAEPERYEDVVEYQCEKVALSALDID